MQILSPTYIPTYDPYNNNAFPQNQPYYPTYYGGGQQQQQNQPQSPQYNTLEQPLLQQGYYTHNNNNNNNNNSISDNANGNNPSATGWIPEDNVNHQFEANPIQPHADRLPDGMTGLKQLDLNRITNKSKLLFVAKSDAGKSVLFKHIMHHLAAQIRAVQVCSKSEKFNHFYETELNIPPTFIHDDISPEILYRNYERQELLYKSGVKPGFDRETDRNLFQIWDDVMAADKTRWKWPILRDILFMGRHFDCGLAAIIQDLMPVEKDERNQFDFIFLFAVDAMNIITNYFDNYGSKFETKGKFRTYLDYYTKEFSTLVLDVKRGSDLQSKWYWFKADLNYKYSIPRYPNSTMHTFHKKYYLPPAEGSQFNWHKNYNGGPGSLPGVGSTVYVTPGGTKNTSKKSTAPTKLVKLDVVGNLMQ